MIYLNKPQKQVSKGFDSQQSSVILKGIQQNGVPNCGPANRLDNVPYDQVGSQKQKQTKMTRVLANKDVRALLKSESLGSKW